MSAACAALKSGRSGRGKCLDGLQQFVPRCPLFARHSIHPHRPVMKLVKRVISEPDLLRHPNGGCVLRFDNDNNRLTVFLPESMLENIFDSFCRIPMMPEPARLAITQIEFFNLANQLRPNATEADKMTELLSLSHLQPFIDGINSQ